MLSVANDSVTCPEHEATRVGLDWGLWCSMAGLGAATFILVPRAPVPSLFWSQGGYGGARHPTQRTVSTGDVESVLWQISSSSPGRLSQECSGGPLL